MLNTLFSARGYDHSGVTGSCKTCIFQWVKPYVASQSGLITGRWNLVGGGHGVYSFEGYPSSVSNSLLPGHVR